jgi:hypothetical protein
MTVGRLGVVSGVVTLLAVSLGAQQTTRTSRALTTKQLQAKIRDLENENATLTRNYDLLRASCQSQVERDAHPAAPGDAVAQNTLPPLPPIDTPPSVHRAPRNVDDDLFRILDVTYGVTETTVANMRFGWKVTILNDLGRNEAFDVTVQFLDKNDLVVGTGHLGVQTIRAHDRQTIDGDAIIGLPAALNVVSAKAVINRHR